MTDLGPNGPTDDLIEAYLRSLRDGSPPPDLSDLEPNDAEEARLTLDVVEVLVNSGPSEVELAHDPVAIRLGLVGTPEGQPVSSAPDDAVTAAVRETERRYSFLASPAATDGTDFERRFECRSMVEHVLVVVSPDPIGPSLRAAHARSAFALSDELSAVVYCSAAATGAVALTYGDCHDKLEPGTGWRPGGDGFNGEPLAVALGRYFEQSDPRWEAVQALDGLDTWEDLAGDVAAVVAGTLRRLATTAVQLPHKRAARDFVTRQPETQFREWATRVQRAEADAERLITEIRQLIEERAT